MCQSHGRRYRRGVGSRADWIRRLEEHQRDLEQELADTADLLERLKDAEPQSEPETEPAQV